VFVLAKRMLLCYNKNTLAVLKHNFKGEIFKMMIETKNRSRLKGKITYTDGREETLEYGAEKIEEEYKGRNDIASILLPNSVESLGHDAFAECAELTSVIMQNGVTSIGHYAFRDCPKLESVIFSEDLEDIGAGLFLGCVSLAEVVVPQKSKFSVEHPFQGCTCKVEIHPKNPYYKIIDGSIYSADGKTLIAAISETGESKFSVPDGVEIIGTYAFARCKMITEITLPESVNAIGESAFEACESLESIIIPAGVEKIATTLLYHCSKLKTVYIPASVKEIGFSAFEKCDELREIHFGGKKSDWKKIKVGYRNTSINGGKLERAKIIFK
jgi:hypothetical protein